MNTKQNSGLRQFLTARWLLSAAAIFVVGSLLGVGLFTFGYAKGYAYLFDDPAACVNCHVMKDQYEGWHKGSHANVATCNDCHTPHNNIIAKYANKGYNGFFHGLGMTTGNHPDNIQIKPINLKITEEACLYCHAELTSQMRSTRIGQGPHNTTQSCLECHSNIGHQ